MLYSPNLSRNLKGGLAKRRSRELISEIRKELGELKEKSDKQDTDVREAEAREVKNSDSAQASAKYAGIGASVGTELSELSKVEVERKVLTQQGQDPGSRHVVAEVEETNSRVLQPVQDG